MLQNLKEEEIKISPEDVAQQKQKLNSNEQNLALSFKYLTENKQYNFQAFIKDKSNFEAFVKRLNSTLIKISNFKIKDLMNPVFKDKFNFSVLYAGTYVHSYKQFLGTEQVISVELSGKQNERIILYHENKEEDGRNILYVLGFDLNHNMYPHEK